MNTFGNILRLTTFGESHGPAIGGVIDGFPAGVKIDFDLLQSMMERRRPGQSAVVTSRREPDEVQFLSGIYNGVTTGTPIAFIIANTNTRSEDYGQLADAFRPNHADFTYQAKYGIRDYRGGGRASARETAVRVAAGALAKQLLRQYGIEVCAFTAQIGEVQAGVADGSCRNEVYCPDPVAAEKMKLAIADARAMGDTLGGIVQCTVTGCPAGLGEPMFAKLQAMLAGAMLSINAAKGFDYGDGFAAASMRGSAHVDEFVADENHRITTATNHSGGIQGGISNGAPIQFRVAFKPVATMMRSIDTVNTRGEKVTLQPRGRHDVCVVPRAVVVVEAMAALVILDAVMMDRSHGATRFV